jgi:hypothetical protein
VRVNFDYEFKLFNHGISPKWGESINRQLEYVSLLWGGIEEISPFSSYDQHYLEKLRKLDFSLPSFSPFSDGSFFWGRELDYSLELKTNSKITSFEVAQKKKWLLPGEYLCTGALNLEKGWVAKPVESVSGRGFIFDPRAEITNTFGAIISPWVDRVLDISCIYRKGRKFFLINLNNSRGVFGGAIVLEEENLKDNIEAAYKIDFDSIQDFSNQIINEYESMNAHTIQVDSFIYKTENQYKYYPLCEVNDRKTMGELALRLKDHLFAQDRAMLMSFGQASMNTDLELSPNEAKFKMRVKSLDDKDLRQFFRSHQG